MAFERVGRTPFVGRQQELATLLNRLEAAGRGEGGLVLVTGEPGIGKTRLAAELADRARAQGWRVLVGRASDAEGMPPYLPLIEALRAYIEGCSSEELWTQLGRGAAEVALLVPAVHDRLEGVPASPAVSPDQERYRLFETVSDFLLAIACAAPQGLLLVLDDLHWADKATLLLLQYLLRRLTTVRLLVAGTYRTAELDRTHPLAAILTELRREERLDRLLLAPLSQEHTTELVAALAGLPAAPPVADAIYQQTQGNPFFLTEVVRHLQAEGRDLADAGAAVAHWGIPEGVRDVIGRQLARLSADAGRMLQAAAVLGNEFDFEMLAAVSGLEFEPLLEAMTDAVRAGLVQDASGGYRFSHALIRETLYDELPVPRKQRLHLRAAEALEGMRTRNPAAHVAALAMHYRLAGVVADPEKALAYCRQAARQAAGVFAWDEAAAHWQAASDLLPPGDDARRTDLLLALGDAQMKAGDRPLARATFEQVAVLARALAAPDLLARVALGLGGMGVEPTVVDDLLVERLQEAVHALDAQKPEREGTGRNDEHRVLRARVLARLALELRFSEAEAGGTALSDAAIAAAQEAGDTEALITALNAKHTALMRPEHLEARGPVARALVNLAVRTGDRQLAWHSHMVTLMNRVQYGDIAAVDAELDACARLVEELRQPSIRWWTMVYQAMRALLAGRFTDCEDLIQQALAIGQRMDSDAARRAYSRQMFALRREQGRLAEQEAEVRRAVADAAAHENRRRVADLQCQEAMLDYELGRIEEARRTFDQLAAQDFAVPRRSTVWLFDLSVLAEVCAGLGDTRRAARLYDLLLPYAERVPGVAPVPCVCLGSVARYLGLLAATLSRWQDAEQHFQHALAMHARMGARPLLAHTAYAYGAMLLVRRNRGDRTRSRDLLAQALTHYTELGMGHYAANAQRLLSDPSLTAMPISVVTYPDGLSEREVEVLRLIAAGKSNKEIAEELVISLNTVFRHITHIFQKTGTANRAAAANYAHRHGLAA